ncbi:MAG TPA: serine protease, partial [Burkholderiales bacterium]|nr:serine protease [Burkholderiales bacterium]
VLYGSDKMPLRARVAAADAKNDVAILTVDLKDRKPRPLSLNKGAAALGSHVFTIGYPHSDVLGVSPKITSGEVSGNLPLDPTKLLISVPVQSGNSGGPLINMSGEVVGLVIEKLPADFMLKATGDVTENTNFALKARYIDALLEDLPRLPTAVAPAKPKTSPLEDLVATYRDSVYFVLTRVPVTDAKEAKK